MSRSARRRQLRRRRGAGLVVVALLALTAAWAAPLLRSGTEAAENAPSRGHAGKPPRGASLERQVGQLLVLSFYGRSVPAYVRDALAGGRASGAVLFARNVGSPSATRKLNADLQSAARGRALIAVDQEGGVIRTLPFAAPQASQSTLGSPGEAEASARRAARELAAAGVNLTLAPVADVGAPGSVVAGRAYPGDAAAVSRSVAAAVRGYRRGGVASTLKHFPGLASATVNTDDAPVTLDIGRRELARRDLAPFRSGVEAGAPVVMAGHARYPALDGRRIASQSPAILDELLRRRLGFRGVVITDSMEADAVLSGSSLETAAVRSVRAGADLLLMTGAGSFPRVRRTLLREARRDPELRRRVEESARRVGALKDSLRRSP